MNRGTVIGDAVTTLPRWLAPVAEVARTATTHDLTRFAPPSEGGRESAVLLLFGDAASDGSAAADPDILIIERAHDMRTHSGQPAFPGGAVDAADTDAVATALREAQEETGLDPSGVVPFGTLPRLYLPPSDFVVTPVLAWWRTTSPVGAVDPAEVASVHRVPIRELVDPAARMRARHPSGYVGAAFDVRGLIVWGFTAGLLDRVIALSGWEQPWDTSRMVPVEGTARSGGPGPLVDQAMIDEVPP
jgi:8-oxo-dGTP pyrophosphatase MutT (NUDIX family)